MTRPTSSVMRSAMSEIAPKLLEFADDVVYGDVWERADLSKRDRSLATVAVLTALNRSDQLILHIRRALDNGVTVTELGELITHVAVYAGWPTAVSAAVLIQEVVAERTAQPSSPVPLATPGRPGPGRQ